MYLLLKLIFVILMPFRFSKESEGIVFVDEIDDK